MRIGRVISSEIAENLDGEGKVLLLKVEISDPDDLQTVELFQQAGMDGRPQDDDAVLIAEISDAWKVALAVDDGIELTAEKGEQEIYSYNASGEKLARVKCTKDGEAVLNDGEDWAVEFSALKAAFDQLKSDFNALIGVYNSHTHVITTPVCLYTGTPHPVSTEAPTEQTGAESTADMADAKVDNVRLP